MPKTVSATEAKNRLGAIIEWVLQNKDEVVVESRGEPQVVVMSIEQYEETKKLREQARRRELLARLEKLRERVSARNQDLTDEEADELANRFSREFVEDLVKEGKIRFKE